MTVVHFATATFPPGQVEISSHAERDFSSHKPFNEMTARVVANPIIHDFSVEETR